MPRSKRTTPVRALAAGHSGEPAATVPGVATHYFTRYQDFENLLQGSALPRPTPDVSDMSAKQLRQLARPGFVSGPTPYRGTDMTDATNPVSSLFPPQTATGFKRVISRSNRQRLHNNDQVPPTSLN